MGEKRPGMAALLGFFTGQQSAAHHPPGTNRRCRILDIAATMHRYSIKNKHFFNDLILGTTLAR
jgi:hypothetical protein